MTKSIDVKIIVHAPLQNQKESTTICINQGE